MRNQEFTFEMTATDVYEYTLKLADGTVLTAEADESLQDPGFKSDW